jgi:hypothetical protein
MVTTSLANKVSLDCPVYVDSRPQQDEQEGLVNYPDVDSVQIVDTARLIAGVYLSLSQSLPQLVLFGDIAPGWKLVKPLIVNIEQDEDAYFVISDDIFFVYGDGETVEQAEKDFTSSLIEYYELLARHDDEQTQALFWHLQSFLCSTSD